MRHVGIVGIGQTPVGTWVDRTLSDLAVASLRSAMQDAGADSVQALYIGNMLSGQLQRQENLGALIADAAGLRGMPSVKIEAGCAAGGAALHMGVLAVAAGVYDTVAVIGVEKMAGYPVGDVLAALATAGALDEAAHGLTCAGLNALIMRRYMYEYSWRHDDFAAFSINAHRNAVTNSNAMFRRPLTLEEYRTARLIADPLTLLDSSPICDGAAAVILCSADAARHFRHKPVRITASAVATDTVALHDRSDILWPRAVYASAKAAYGQAGRSPQDIDLFELHDAFSITAALSLEASGFAEKGAGVRLAQDGAIALEGSIPICTFGGLKARGHPVGASGLYQAVEAVMQLRADAGNNQVEAARIAMIQSIAGSGSFVATHILEV